MERNKNKIKLATTYGIMYLPATQCHFKVCDLTIYEQSKFYFGRNLVELENISPQVQKSGRNYLCWIPVWEWNKNRMYTSLHHTAEIRPILY